MPSEEEGRGEETRRLLQLCGVHSQDVLVAQSVVFFVDLLDS